MKLLAAIFGFVLVLCISRKGILVDIETAIFLAGLGYYTLSVLERKDSK